MNTNRKAHLETSYSFRRLGITKQLLLDEFKSSCLSDVAKKLGVSPQSIWSWCKKLAINYKETNGQKIGIQKTQRAVREWIDKNGQPSSRRMYTKHTDATKRKISESKKGVGWSESRIKAQPPKKPRIKPVVISGKEYDPNWIEIRKQIYIRDKGKCRECGVKTVCRDGESKKVIQCHHIDFDITNNSNENLITLCASCHSKTRFRKQEWINYYKSKMGGL